MNYLKHAIDLSRISFEAGEFPAGAVLISKDGHVYESKPSLPHNHGEMMVIDMAISAEGAPLTDATIYASMEPCLMCISKMYWSGIDSVEYVIPKKSIKAEYAYENAEAVGGIAVRFFKPIHMINRTTHLEEALQIYNSWVKKIEKQDSL